MTDPNKDRKRQRLHSAEVVSLLEYKNKQPQNEDIADDDVVIDDTYEYFLSKKEFEEAIELEDKLWKLLRRNMRSIRVALVTLDTVRWLLVKETMLARTKVTPHLDIEMRPRR